MRGLAPWSLSLACFFALGRKDDISPRRQLDRAAQFAEELKEGAVTCEQYNVRPYIRGDSGHTYIHTSTLFWHDND